MLRLANRAAHDFAEYFPVSSSKPEGLDELRTAIFAHLPEGPAYFPPDHITDQPERFLGAELIREKILRATREEVPHSVAVIVDRWDEQPDITRILATIYVEKDGQKVIVGAARVGAYAAELDGYEQVETLRGRDLVGRRPAQANEIWARLDRRR